MRLSQRASTPSDSSPARKPGMRITCDPVAGRRASPAEDRVDEQAGQLRLPAQLAHVGAPPAALGRVLCLRRERVEAGVLDAIGHVQRWLAPVGHGSRRVRLPRRAAAQTGPAPRLSVDRRDRAPGAGSAVAWVATPDAPERQPELSMSFVLPSSTMPTPRAYLLERDVRLERCRLPHLQAAPERARRRPRDRLHARMLGTVHGDARRELLEVLRADQRGPGHDDPGPSVPHARAPGAVVADDLALPVVEVHPLPEVGDAVVAVADRVPVPGDLVEPPVMGLRLLHHPGADAVDDLGPGEDLDLHADPRPVLATGEDEPLARP